MLQVHCTGSPHTIGLTHGTRARTQIHTSLSFYRALFQQKCGLDWSAVLERASAFEAQIRERWPAYYEEMAGIAEGAGVSVGDVVALNVRTEIVFGLADGCSCVALKSKGEGEGVWMGQNWDWMTAQKPNLIILKITNPPKPTLIQVTEAGIIGKIGFNAVGLGTLLNAIRVPGADPTRLPVHLGLRMALESASVEEALRALESCGMASSAHILVGDEHTAVGLEFTKSTFARCEMQRGSVVHTNHLLKEHPGEVDTVWLKDSLTRMETMTANVGMLGGQFGWEEVSRLFEDEGDGAASICRRETEETGSATLFNIVMDLKSRKAVVRLGRPTEVEETITLQL